MARSALTFSTDLTNALRAVGLADDDTKRIVIDIRAGHIPVIYIEKFANQKDLISVVTALGGVQIEVRKAEEGGQ